MTIEIQKATTETWDQKRSTEQLLGFIARREAEIFSTEE